MNFLPAMAVLGYLAKLKRDLHTLQIAKWILVIAIAKL